MKVQASEPIARRCRAFLDDVEVTNDCTFADEEAGIVTLFVRDEHGKHVIDREAYGGPCVATVTKHGRVRIVVRPEGWPGPSPDAVLISESADGKIKTYDDSVKG